MSNKELKRTKDALAKCSLEHEKRSPSSPLTLTKNPTLGWACETEVRSHALI